MYKEFLNTKEMNKQMLSLQIMDGYTRDVGRGIARIDYGSMASIGASTWDVVEIHGNKKTLARCLPLYPADDGENLLRTDKLVQNNAEISEGDLVKIRKARKIMTRGITISPLQPIPILNERYLRDALDGVSVIEKDRISVPYFDEKLLFDIVKTVPLAGGVINQKTVFYTKDKEHIRLKTLNC